jgi:Arc/MetJ-type ribon-helix-helix transcriptional regulator
VKEKRVRLSASCPPMFAIYIDELIARGLYGDTRSEVVRVLLGGALMEKLSGETVRKLVEKHKGKPSYPHE